MIRGRVTPPGAARSAVPGGQRPQEVPRIAGDVEKHDDPSVRLLAGLGDELDARLAETAYASHDTKLFDLALRRMRPGYLPAVHAWLALHPLKNPKAPPDPSYMPQYEIAQEAQAAALTARANAYFSEGETAAGTADKYVRLTVLLAAVLFLVGIGSRFPVLVARYALLGVAAALLILSVVQLLSLPGPPS